MQTISPARHMGKREPARNRLLEAALQYAGRGWRVFPVHSPTAAGCSCARDCGNSIGKHPRTTHGQKDACTDVATITGWWKRWPDANIGIATGPASGIFVLDVDGEQGQDSLAALKPLPRTLRTISGRKGREGKRSSSHLYFSHPAGVTVRGSIGTLGKSLDVKAAGGYVIAPPSLHASGLRYEWEDTEAAIADPPTWLIAQTSGPPIDAVPMQKTGFVYEGERDNTLFRLAAKWRRDEANQDEIYSRLRAVNSRSCKPPLASSQLLKIARSAAAYPPGGPDPLEEAWAKAAAEGHFFTWDRFLALVRHLHNSRPGLPILLPVERIGKLIGCDRTLIGRHRKRAIEQGLIQECEKYIAHHRATRFKVTRVTSEKGVSH